MHRESKMSVGSIAFRLNFSDIMWKPTIVLAESISLLLFFQDFSKSTKDPVLLTRRNLVILSFCQCFTQIYDDLYGDAVLVLTWVSSNMADGNQQKHLLPSFATKAWIYSSRNS